MQEIMEMTESKSEAIMMAHSLTARYQQPLYVVYLPRKIPRSYKVLDAATFAAEYQGEDWAQLILSTIPDQK
jgi:hypothetical protein